MDLIFILLCITSIAILLLFFITGYLLGKMSSITNNNGVSKYNRQFIISDQQDIQQSIDDSKFVVKIKTDQLEKKYEELGEIKSSEENITSSVSKLKNIKG